MTSPGSGLPRLRHNSLALGLSDVSLPLLRDLIEEHAGVHFDDSKLEILADKVSELVTALDLPSLIDYYYLLRYDGDAPRHWARLMDRLAVPETYFWRQADQLETLANVVAPRLLASSPGTLRIWSAACCSGEEPLSIAIALAEGGLLGKRVQVIASDASEAMLARAHAGLYRERAFRQLPEALREKYFTREGDAWRPRACLTERVTWHRANLAEPGEYATFATAPVIFCRNVFIYFSDAAIRKVALAFNERMPIGGHLFLGAAESLTRFGLPFELAEIGRSFVYVKTPPGGDA